MARQLARYRLNVGAVYHSEEYYQTERAKFVADVDDYLAALDEEHALKLAGENFEMPERYKKDTK